jgi:hypothetical protein
LNLLQLLYEDINMSILRGLLLKISLLISLSCIFTFTLTSPGYCDDWVYIFNSQDYTDYYNKRTININKNTHIIKVWIKRKYTVKGKIEFLNFIKQKGDSIDKYISIDHSLLLHYINYKEREFSINNSTWYSTTGYPLLETKLPIELEKYKP